MDARLEHGPRPSGADDTTMLLWHVLNDAGDAGMTRDELVAVVGPRVNVGHAKRRYLAVRLRDYNKYSSGADRLRTGGIGPTFENTDPERAKRYLVTDALNQMRRNGSVLRDEERRYRAGRKPRAARYQQNDAIIDASGVRTRTHFGTNEAVRVLKPALERRRASYRAQLNDREWRALERLVELAEEELRAGFPTWLPNGNGDTH